MSSHNITVSWVNDLSMPLIRGVAMKICIYSVIAIVASFYFVEFAKLELKAQKNVSVKSSPVSKNLSPSRSVE